MLAQVAGVLLHALLHTLPLQYLFSEYGDDGGELPMAILRSGLTLAFQFPSFTVQS